MSDIFNDPKVKENLLKFLEAQNKPKEKSYQPYYTEEYAKAAKVIIDKVLETKEPYRVDAKDISPITLRLQFYQGKKYLADNNPAYATIVKRTKCTTYQTYIEITSRRYAYNENQAINLATVSQAIHNPNWREELITFITASPELNAKHHEKNVILSPDDIIWAQNQLIGLESLFLFKFESNEILIIRHDN